MLNGATTSNIHTTNLSLCALSKEAILSYAIPYFKYYSLFYVPRSTKLGYKVKFGENVIVMKNGQTILVGHFDPKTNLFWIDITDTAKQTTTYPMNM